MSPGTFSTRVAVSSKVDLGREQWERDRLQCRDWSPTFI